MPESVMQILQRLARGDEDARVAGVEGLARNFGASPQELDTTFEVLQRMAIDHSPKVRACVCTALVRCTGQHADFSSSIRRRARLTAYLTLESMENDRDPAVLRYVMAAQMTLANEALRSALETSTGETEEAVTEMIEMITNKRDPELRETLLGGLPPHRPANVEELKAIFRILEAVMRDPSPQVRREVCKAAARCVLLHGEDSPKLSLIPRSIGRGGSIREETVYRALELLQRLENDPDPSVRKIAEEGQLRVGAGAWGV